MWIINTCCYFHHYQIRILLLTPLFYITLQIDRYIPYVLCFLMKLVKYTLYLLRTQPQEPKSHCTLSNDISRASYALVTLYHSTIRIFQVLHYNYMNGRFFLMAKLVAFNASRLYKNNNEKLEIKKNKKKNWFCI